MSTTIKNYNGFNVLILGNGFDAHINAIKTSFESFLRNGIIDSKNDFDTKEKNLILFLLYLRFFAKGYGRGTLFKTVLEDDPNWMDVEGFIKVIATDKHVIEGIYQAMSYRKDNCFIPANLDNYIYSIGKFLAKLNLPEKDYDYSTIKNLLADNLTDFEKRFSDYILNQIKDRDDYSKKQISLVDTIINKVKAKAHYTIVRRLQIVNFNYTKNTLTYNTEANVHGVLGQKIVIGYDSTQDIIKESDVFELSKDWRKIDIEYTFLPENDDIKAIIVYGHSLGEQDYPYFFEIFDKCNFLTDMCDVKLFLCYSKWDSPQCEKRIEQYKMNASKMLNAYERYVIKNLSRNTLVTKLIIKGRLFFVEIK